jgi:hypothetical protein
LILALWHLELPRALLFVLAQQSAAVGAMVVLDRKALSALLFAQFQSAGPLLAGALADRKP